MIINKYIYFILGVTHATLDNWKYFDVIRKVADPICSENIVNSVSTIDDILASNSPSTKRELKKAFGLEDLEHDDDFASLLEVS